MEANHKKILKAVVLELRHMFEGYYNGSGWHAGDLEQRLNALGVWRDRKSLEADELAHLAPADREARRVFDAYLKLREEAGVGREEAVAEFVRETAYTWANRLLALRCMEARELIDEVILQKQVYGGRSLAHNRFAQRHAEQCVGEDDGLLAVLEAAFAKQAQHLRLLFDPKAPGVALKPGVAALKRAIAVLSGTSAVRGQEPATSEVFRAPDAFGWAYQYWNTEEKDRVFEKVRTQKGTKIEGADIIPATQLYTEPYMVKFLVQNSLGAVWANMNPETALTTEWEYYVKDADRPVVEQKAVADITFLDPACGSGHFLLEAFDLFYRMYEEDGEITEPESICRSVLHNNLYGIDIDERAVQISEAALWMKAAEKLFQKTGSTSFTAVPANLVATNIRLPKGVDHLKAFLDKHPEDKDLSPALEIVLNGLQHADELGSLIQIEGPVKTKLKQLQQHEEELARRVGVQSHFYETPVEQGHLPIGIESYEEWRQAAIQRVKRHFEEEGEAADLGEVFFGRSAARCLHFLEILDRQYDVVAANPPYMGLKNMSAALKSYVEVHYSAGKRDLYTCFISRCCSLAQRSGRIAMVTQQSWMFLRTYAAFRSETQDTAHCTGLLREHAIELLAHLGPGAFGEISGEVVNTVLFILRMGGFTTEHTLTAFRVVGATDPGRKAAILRGRTCPTHRPLQSDLLAIHESPVVYWWNKPIFDALKRIGKVGQKFEALEGLGTRDDIRFTRRAWEIGDRTRLGWVRLAKGGGYCKWYSISNTVVRWGDNGAAVKAYNSALYGGGHWSRQIRNTHRYFTQGLTYSKVASGSLGVRILDSDSIFGEGGPSIFGDAAEMTCLLGLLNSRIPTYIMRGFSPQLEFRFGYLLNVPAPVERASSESFTRVVNRCVELKKQLLSVDLLSDTYLPQEQSRSSLFGAVTEMLLENLRLSAILHTFEAENEHRAWDAYDLPVSERSVICDELGVPPGWRSLLPGYEGPLLPELQLSGGTGRFDEFCTRREVDIEQIRAVVRKCFETRAETEASSDDEDTVADKTSEDEERNDFAARIPSETLLEQVATEGEIHPISAYLLIKEGVEKYGWTGTLEHRRITFDLFSSVILRLLGHRWPRQVADGEPIASWAAPEGIICLIDGIGRPLIVAVQERARLEFDSAGTPFEQDFNLLTGMELENWIEREFFKRHSTQFKRRPICWQIQSKPFTTHQKPAFAALFYYHRSGPHILTAIQSQYVRPQRRRAETEVRGIESIPQSARSDRQEERLSELLDSITELRNFDEQLEEVSRSGFGPDKLRPQLRQYAIDDAMLCLKARWLQNLSDMISAGPLREWRERAEDTKLHADLHTWIVDTMTTLRRYCSAVGQTPPKEQSLHDEPTPALLASLICQDSDEMASNAVILACNAWWKPLDEAVLAPLRSQIKEAKDELKRLKQEDYSKADDPFQRRKEIDARSKELKEDLKQWERSLKDKAETADKLRKDILAWHCPEARTWETWLASQPMYDAISSLDGVRQPPQNVADFVAQESIYAPDVNDGVRVNIAPLQKAGLLASDVLAAKEVDKAIADRAEWRADERRWCREGKLPQPGWWSTEKKHASGQD